MHKRFLTLLALVVLLGFATKAFGQSVALQSPITRAGAVALLVEANPALKSRLEQQIRMRHPLPLFADVSYSEWYAPYIETAFEAGIVTGNKDQLFRPGDLLTEEEAIALSARYHAITHPEMLTEVMAEDETWFNSVVMASVHGGLKLPFPIKLGQPITRSALFALMSSMNIENPSQIAISHAPARPVVTASVINTTPRPAQPITPRPAQPSSQGSSQAPVVPVVSQKPFAITMPTLGVKDLTITHPSDPFTKDGLHAPLKNGVGHLFSYPGKGGKILVYGHSSSVPWDVSSYTKIFRQINKLNVGDRIEITYAGTVFTYEVTHKQTVPAEDMSAYQQGGGEELILYTCWPPDSIKERYLVHAKPVQAVAVR